MKPFKKMLWVGFQQPEMREAFNLLSDNITEINCRTEKLDEAIKQVGTGFDFAFIQIQGEFLRVHPDTITKLREAGCFTMNWMGDVRTPFPDWFKICGNAFNVSTFTNQPAIDIMRADGYKADYFQIGFDPKLYFPNHEAEKKFDVCFQSNNYSTFGNSKFRRDVAKTVQSKYRKDFALYGGGWEQVAVKATGNSFDRPAVERLIYQTSKIGLNISNEVLPRYTSDRIFRLMGSGCFCLSQYFEGYEHEFPAGTTISTFENIPQLLEKIEYYLSHEAERKEIAIAGCENVHAFHTWEKRMPELLKLYETYK